MPRLVLTAFRCWAGSWHGPRVPRGKRLNGCHGGNPNFVSYPNRLMAAQPPGCPIHRIRYTTVIATRWETEQSEADEMLNDASPCITAQPRLRTARSSDRQEGRPCEALLSSKVPP